MTDSRISGRTALYALIGSPVAHSGSPAMYNYSFQRLGIDSVYLAFDVPKEGVGDAVRAMRTMNIRGYNVTMPDKLEVMKYLDRLSREAELIGAVNTVVNREGVLTGYCTDGIGFVQNLADHGIPAAGRVIAVAGAGGAATAIQVQCALSGAEKVIILKRKNRTFERALQTAEKIRSSVPGCDVEVLDQNDADAVTAAAQKSDIFVNATSVGMAPDADGTVLPDPSAFRKGLVVADAVYNPVETRLLKDARAAGCRCIGGKGMLLWQGVEAFRLFTGEKMPVQEVKTRFFAGA